jgi:hypothetical protein
MTADVKTYKVEVEGSENGYIVICSANGHLKDLMEQLKACANCKVTEVNRDAIDDLKAMQTIYEKMS